MPVIRVHNYVDAYRLRANAKDIHELAASHFRHQELDQTGNIVESEFRYDYVFTI